MEKIIKTYIYAIEQEIKIKNLYSLFEKSFKSDELKKIFKQLSETEKLHYEKLKKNLLKIQPDLKLNINENSLPKATNDTNLNDPKSVLEFALQQEKAASKYYRKSAEEETDPEVKNLLTELAQEEINHQKIIEDQILNMEGSFIWHDESELNGLFEY